MSEALQQWITKQIERQINLKSESLSGNMIDLRSEYSRIPTMRNSGNLSNFTDYYNAQPIMEQQSETDSKGSQKNEA